MRNKFREALLTILGGSFTNMTELIWVAYRDNLRDINPDDLPENVRFAFKQIKEKLEGKLEEKVKQRRPYWSNEVSLTPEEFKNKVREELVQCKHRDSPLNGMNTQDVKVALFEIYEKLPQRVRKPKVKLEVSEPTGNE